MFQASIGKRAYGLAGDRERLGERQNRREVNSNDGRRYPVETPPWITLSLSKLDGRAKWIRVRHMARSTIFNFTQS